MRSWVVLLAVLSLVTGCKRGEPIECAEPPAPPSGCTYDAECELVTGGCCGEMHLLAPARKTQRAKAWLDACAPRPPCGECEAPKDLVAHCVKGVCAAVERKAEPPTPAVRVVVDAGRATGDASVDAGEEDCPTDGGRSVRACRGQPVRPGVDAGEEDCSMDGGRSVRACRGQPETRGADAGASCAAEPVAPSCERDADCDVVLALTECCVNRTFPVRAGATVPVRQWVRECLPRSTCSQSCELPDEQGGRCVKGTCTAVVTRVRSFLEKRPWDLTTPRRGVLTPGKLEPSGKKPLPPALVRWLRARVPGIEACFTKALQGESVGPPATKVFRFVADAKGVTQLSVEGDELDELAADCPGVTLKDAGRPAGVTGKARYEFSWTLGFRGEVAQAKRKR